MRADRRHSDRCHNDRHDRRPRRRPRRRLGHHRCRGDRCRSAPSRGRCRRGLARSREQRPHERVRRAGAPTSTRREEPAREMRGVPLALQPPFGARGCAAGKTERRLPSCSTGCNTKSEARDLREPVTQGAIGRGSYSALGHAKRSERSVAGRAAPDARGDASRERRTGSRALTPALAGPAQAPRRRGSTFAAKRSSPSQARAGESPPMSGWRSTCPVSRASATHSAGVTTR